MVKAARTTRLQCVQSLTEWSPRTQLAPLLLLLLLCWCWRWSCWRQRQELLPLQELLLDLPVWQEWSLPLARRWRLRDLLACWTHAEVWGLTALLGHSPPWRPTREKALLNLTPSLGWPQWRPLLALQELSLWPTVLQ